ncbi:hypothetical protein T484DRAFT_1926668, partial [Baffinella frigidus]
LAWCRAVQPWPSRHSTLAPSWHSVLTTSSCPSAAAKCSGAVRVSLWSPALMSTPICSSAVTAFTLPSRAMAMSALAPAAPPGVPFLPRMPLLAPLLTICGLMSSLEVSSSLSSTDGSGGLSTSGA